MFIFLGILLFSSIIKIKPELLFQNQIKIFY